MRNLDAPPCAIKPPKRRYSASDALRVKEPGNVVRLRALVRLLNLSPKEVSRATGFSRSYISRVLSCKDDFTGSHSFFRTLEHKLPDVIAGRTAQFFTIPAVPVQRAREVLDLAA
jgi:transcriptional regulator with XRE-family HTH domain